MHPREHTSAERRSLFASSLLLTAFVEIIVLLVAIVGSAQVRERVALGDPHFDAQEPRRMLWSDPALLYYFTERIVENGGTAPADLRADERVQWPDRIDDFALETIGQEYVAAWWHRLLGGGEPLHLSCLRSMAWAASLAAVGVFGLALELTGSALLGGVAALLFALLSANYRTIGFILIREDFALPWFALHLWLLARAARVRTAASFALCGLAALAALSTWHAMGFVVAIEAAVALLWFLRTGENALAGRYAWLLPAVVAAGSFVVPALRTKVAALSLPMQIAIGLLAAAAFVRARRSQRTAQATGAQPRAGLGARIVAVVGVAAAALAARGISQWRGGGIGDYSHVLALMVAKLVHFGRLPDDPNALEFEARLLWQGPFETGSVSALLQGLTVAVPALLWLIGREAWTWLSGRGDARRAWLAAFSAAALLVAWLVERTQVVIGLVAPVALVVVCAAIGSARVRAAALLAALLGAAIGMGLFVTHARLRVYGVERQFRDGRVSWEAHPHEHELPPLLSWIERSLPADAAITADFVTSTAILAHTRRPILLQPKYESKVVRDRIHEFLDAWYRGAPSQLAQWMRDHRSRYLVVHAGYLGPGSLYLDGFPDRSPTRYEPESCAARFLGDPERVPGFHLLYRSPPALRTDLFRVYELE
jgi:hypothetical protein